MPEITNNEDPISDAFLKENELDNKIQNALLLLQLKTEERDSLNAIFLMLILAALSIVYVALAPSQVDKLIAIALTIPTLLLVAISRYLKRSLKPISYNRALEHYTSTRAEMDAAVLAEDIKKESKPPNDSSVKNPSNQGRVNSGAIHISNFQGYLELGNFNKNYSVDQVFLSISNRLKDEAQDQGKRGTLNLMLGITTTLAGLVVLGYSVFTVPANQTPNEMIAHFAPRLSLVVLIEVFAYFFLRLYKQSLSEIKYFQNEITNIESRHIALALSSNDTDKEIRYKVTEELVKTERNFLMSKDQTTVEIEKERLSHTTFGDLLNAIKDLGKKKE